MFEVPRNAVLHVGKLALGAILLVVGIAPAAHCTAPDPVVAPFLLVGLAIVAANLRLLITCPPLLRATADGLWLGGGSIIPWHDVAAIYYPPQRKPGDRGRTFQTRELRIAFRSRRALLAAPWSLWPAILPLGRIAIPLVTIHIPARGVVARLEAMRLRACGSDIGLPGRGKLPVARVVTK